LSEAKGWLEEGDPFFKMIEKIIKNRNGHTPRLLEKRRTKWTYLLIQIFSVELQRSTPILISRPFYPQNHTNHYLLSSICVTELRLGCGVKE